MIRFTCPKCDQVLKAPDEIYRAAVASGVPGRLADRAFKFAQIAWGRFSLGTLGVQFSPDDMCFNADGEVVESGRLEDEPCFAAATRLVERFALTPAYQRLAYSSADFNTVIDARRAGSKLEILETGPAGVFLEAPTKAGLRRATERLTRHLAGRKRR
jgi:hypothetical protein